MSRVDDVAMRCEARRGRDARTGRDTAGEMRDRERSIRFERSRARGRA